jgi:hypothetical protein
MTGADVNLHIPLIRLNALFPGQMGVEGAWTDTGLRTHSTGTVFYVSPNHPGASDLRDGTDPTDPLLTIQTAVTRCESYRGDIIAVMPHGEWRWSPGTPYPTGIRENVTLNKHGVRLIGLSSASIGIPWYVPTDGGTALTVTGIDCIVEGFCFVGYTPGALNTGRAIFGNYAYCDNLTVRHCHFDHTLEIGIQLDDVWYARIHDNFFEGVQDYGIYADPAGASPQWNEIDHNSFNQVGVGAGIAGTGAIFIPGADDCRIHHNSVYNSGAQGAALATLEGIVTNDGAGVVGLRNLVWENVFSCQNTAAVNGDYGDLNNGSPTDAWSHSLCMNGLAYGVP